MNDLIEIPEWNIDFFDIYMMNPDMYLSQNGCNKLYRIKERMIWDNGEDLRWLYKETIKFSIWKRFSKEIIKTISFRKKGGKYEHIDIPILRINKSIVSFLKQSSYQLMIESEYYDGHSYRRKMEDVTPLLLKRLKNIDNTYNNMSFEEYLDKKTSHLLNMDLKFIENELKNKVIK